MPDRRLLLPAAGCVLGLLACGGGEGRAPARATPGASAAAPSPAPSPAATARPPAPELLSAASRRSFRRLAASLPGREGVALAGPGGRVVRLGALQSGVAWSTAKVPVAMAAVRGEVAEATDLAAAIRVSDNPAAERLWTALGGGTAAARAAEREIRAAGDERTRVQSRVVRPGFTAFGQTTWTLSDQVRFMAGMRCLPEGRRVRRLMTRIDEGQRWGLGTLPGAAFKGGWGPGATGGWLERQMGDVRLGGRTLAVALASGAPDHERATQALTRLAAWVAEHADPAALGPRRAC